jgi:hypothetical protein
MNVLRETQICRQACQLSLPLAPQPALTRSVYGLRGGVFIAKFGSAAVADFEGR